MLGFCECWNVDFLNPGFWMLDFCRSWTWDIVKDLNMMEHIRWRIGGLISIK